MSDHKLHQNKNNWTIFKFVYPERAIIGEDSTQKTNQKTIQKTTQKTIQKPNRTAEIHCPIFNLKAHPSATRNELTKSIPDSSLGGIIYNLTRLQELGILKRIGGHKEGYWAIVSK